MKHRTKRVRALGRRYGHAGGRMDRRYFHRVAETFMHPIRVRAYDAKVPTEADVAELADTLERVAEKARAGQ